MTHTIKTLSFGIIAALVFLTGFALFYTAKANPSFFIRSNNTACGNYTATTSPTFLTVGTAATTTAIIDTGCAAAGSADSMLFIAQFTGSSTASTENIAFEYSQDAVDWYAQTITATTSPMNVTVAQTYTLPFASTTVGGASGPGNGRITRAIVIVPYARYIRAVETLPVGSLNGAVWGEFVAKRQGN